MSDFEQMKQGMAILEKYGFDSLWAEHDEIHAGCVEDVSPEDIAALDELGWHAWDNDNFVMFV